MSLLRHLLFPASLALAVLAGCKPPANPGAGAAAAAPKEHPLTGEVIAVTPERSAVLVHHEEIPGFMPPMTMEFIVTPADLARLKAGQRLRARMVQDDKDALRLDAIEVLDPVKEAAVLAAANQLRQDTTMRGKEAYREVGETIPSFSLYDQHGNVFSPAQVRGRWVVMNFIYTRCPIATMCPASTQRMMDLQAAGRTAGRTDLELISLSLDPVYDTPSVLKDYADARGIDLANFRFLTGPEAAVRDLLHQFGVIVEPGENFLKHTLSTLLINPEGRIVHRVDGTNWAPSEFLRRLPAPTKLVATPLASPAGADTGESSLHPGPDGTVYLTFSGPGRAAGERGLWLATLAPGAALWSAPRPIVSTPRLMENWADFASLAVGTDGQLWAQWFQRQAGEDAHGYDGWCARSADGGATWTTPAPLGHEFVSLAPVSGGRMLAVWLESARVRNPNAPRVKRDPNGPRPAKDANAPYAPSMRLKSRLLDAAGETLQEWVVDPDVCTCCQTTLARLPGDQVVVAYRGHLPDETRDNQVARFDGAGWSRPQPLHADGWVIPGCPVNGPAADATGEQLAVAWFTAAQGLARVQVKFSPDGGRSFGPARPVDLGRPIGRVDLVTLPDGSAVVSWLEARTEQNQAGLYVRRFFADGAASAPLLVAATSAVRASGFARLAARPGPGLPVIISWTDATPADPANEKSPAVTRVLTAEFSAAALGRAPSVALAAPLQPPVVVRSGLLVFPEFCVASTAVDALH
jgi:protein SCO1/2